VVGMELHLWVEPPHYRRSTLRSTTCQMNLPLDGPRGRFLRAQTAGAERWWGSKVELKVRYRRRCRWVAGERQARYPRILLEEVEDEVRGRGLGRMFSCYDTESSD